MQIIEPLFVYYTHFSKTSRNHASTFHFKSGNLHVETHCLTTTKTQTMNNQHADAILVNPASYAHPCVESCGKSPWPLPQYPGPVNVTKTRQKIEFFWPVTLISGQRKLIP